MGQKLQELELDLSKNQQDVGVAAKDIDECLLVLRAAADRLAPDEATRAVMRKQEGAIRDLASRAEVHSDPEVRKTAGFFNKRLPNCTLSTAPLKKYGHGWSRKWIGSRS